MTVTLPPLLVSLGILALTAVGAVVGWCIAGLATLMFFDHPAGEWFLVLRWPLALVLAAAGAWLGVSLL